MAHISGFERSQLLLLPEAVDDYVGPDNPVRFIDAFVDGLDLSSAGLLRVAPKVTGRPGYAPGDFLKLYIYGYLNRVQSSRRGGVPSQHRGHLAAAYAEARTSRPSRTSGVAITVPSNRCFVNFALLVPAA